jgi:hypothetical protein
MPKINTKQILFIPLIVFVALIISVFILINNKFNFFEPIYLSGNIKVLKTNYLIIEGGRTNSEKVPLNLGPDLKAREFKIYFDNKTQFKRIALHIPNTTEMFKTDDLEKDETLVTIDVLTKDFSERTIGIFIKARRTFWGSLKIVEAEYRIPVFK